MGKYQLCVPARYGAATGAVVGFVVWALVAWVPAFHSGVPEPVVAVLPFALAWLGHTAAAWIAPHPAAAAPAAALPDAGGGSTAGVTGPAASAASGTVRIIPPGTKP